MPANICWPGSQTWKCWEHSSGDEHDLRVDCFRAAELLYLHAADHGNTVAYANLGYVYSYDRCEGLYWDAKPETPYPTEQRAFECYSVAANKGDPESMYKVGDLLLSGRGCEPDAKRAYGLFLQSYELGKGEPVVWGSAAFRLGQCHEEATGCEQSFELALQWYRLAVTGLDIAVNSGDWFYEKVLAAAKKKVARIEQELDGRY